MFKKPAIDGLKRALVVIVAVSCVFVLWIFVNSRNGRVETDPVKDIAPKSGLAIGEIKHEATRNGVVEWKLEARSAEYFNEEKEALLHDLYVTLYLKNNEKAFVRAKEGILKIDENNIFLTGNVTLDKQGYNFQTQRLVYTHEKRWVHSEAPVTIKGNFVHLTADAMTIDLNTNKTVLKGHVKGAIHEQTRP